MAQNKEKIVEFANKRPDDNVFVEGWSTVGARGHRGSSAVCDIFWSQADNKSHRLGSTYSELSRWHFHNGQQYFCCSYNCCVRQLSVRPGVGGDTPMGVVQGGVELQEKTKIARRSFDRSGLGTVNVMMD